MRRVALLALSLCLTTACGKQTFLAAAFVQTPALPNPQDASKPIPPFQILTAYFGTVDTADPTKIDASKLATIDDATAQVAFHHKPAAGATGTDVEEDRVLDVAAKGNGSYLLSSKDDERLTFEQTPYTLVLTTAGENGEAYGARLSPGPVADMEEFKNTTCTVPGTATKSPRCMEISLGSGFTLTRDDTPAAGQSRPPAFVLVGRIDPNNPSAEPEVTFKTVPADAKGLLEYVLSDAPHRWASYSIPASAFPQSGIYVVTLLTARTGKVSGNAFVGSVAIAGSGSAGVLRVP